MCVFCWVIQLIWKIAMPLTALAFRTQELTSTLSILVSEVGNINITATFADKQRHSASPIHLNFFGSVLEKQETAILRFCYSFVTNFRCLLTRVTMFDVTFRFVRDLFDNTP